MTPTESGQVALELERLRGSLGESLAEIKGALTLLVHRSDQTDRALSELQLLLSSIESRVDKLETAEATTAKAATDAGKAAEAVSTRLSAVEKLAWTALGVGVAAVPAGGWLVSVMTK